MRATLLRWFVHLAMLPTIVGSLWALAVAKQEPPKYPLGFDPYAPSPYFQSLLKRLHAEDFEEAEVADGDGEATAAVIADAEDEYPAPGVAAAAAPADGFAAADPADALTSP